MEKGYEVVVLKAKGASINKGAEITEGIKKSIPSLHQIGVVSSVSGEETWDSFDSSLDKSNLDLMMTITFSTREMENVSPKFQAQDGKRDNGQLHILSDVLHGELMDLELSHPNTSTETMIIAIFYENGRGVFCATDSMMTRSKYRKDNPLLIDELYTFRNYGKFLELYKGGQLSKRTTQNADVYLMFAGSTGRLSDLFKALLRMGNLAVFSSLETLAMFCAQHFQLEKDLPLNIDRGLSVVLVACEHNLPTVFAVNTVSQNVCKITDFVCSGTGSGVVTIGSGIAEGYDVCLPNLARRTYDDAVQEAILAVMLAKKRHPSTCGGKVWFLDASEFGILGPDIFDEEIFRLGIGPELSLKLD